METIKSWIFSVCIAGIVATVTQMLIPKGNMEKVIKITVRAFVLSVLIAPLVINPIDLADIKTDFELGKYDYDKQLQEDINRMVSDGLSAEVKTMIETNLSAIKVNADSISVQTTVTGNNSAEITGVTVVLNKSYKIKEIDIRHQISKIAECDTQLVYSGGN